MDPFTLIGPSDRAKVHVLGRMNAGISLIGSANRVEVDGFCSVDTGSSCFLVRKVDGVEEVRSKEVGSKRERYVPGDGMGVAIAGREKAARVKRVKMVSCMVSSFAFVSFVSDFLNCAPLR